MNQTAANKLLKLIEEPGERTLIIIVTDDAGSGYPYHIITMPEGGIPPYRTG